MSIGAVLAGYLKKRRGPPAEFLLETLMVPARAARMAKRR